MNLYEIIYEVRDGENEYQSSDRIAAPDMATAEIYAEQAVRQYFGEETEWQNGTSNYWTADGTRCVRVRETRLIEGYIVSSTTGRLCSFTVTWEESYDYGLEATA